MDIIESLPANFDIWRISSGVRHRMRYCQVYIRKPAPSLVNNAHAQGRPIPSHRCYQQQSSSDIITTPVRRSRLRPPDHEYAWYYNCYAEKPADLIRHNFIASVTRASAVTMAETVCLDRIVVLFQLSISLLVTVLINYARRL